MKTFFCDIETYSSADLKRTGAVKYAEADDFEILLMSYAFDDEPIKVWDFTKDGPPSWLAWALTDPTIEKMAWNISFERACFNKALGIYTPPEQWRDIMTLAAMNGLPMSLEAAGEVLQITQQKLSTGKALINYFCKPCRPTISNGGRTRNLPHHNPEKWEDFKTYCGVDTEAERLIYQTLQRFPVPDFERELEAMDARCNERGVLADLELAEAAVFVDEKLREEHTEELRRLTGLDNPNSVAQLKDWLATVGVECDSLDKNTVQNLRETLPDPTTKRVLELRQLLGKTSTKKYQAILDAACKDHRVRGLLQYYGAGRTGRWAGRRVQLQNLAQNHLDDIADVREVVRQRDLETLELLYDSVPDVLSQLIRTALVAKEGYTFLVADYSAIEARVIAYLAGEQWRMDVFANGGDIYCSSASQMFKVPVEKHGVNGHLRQKGKVAELACGYGGGVAALKAFGAEKMGLTESEMQDIVTQWRLASPTIPRLWRRIEDAARSALESPGSRCKVLRGANGKVCTFWRDRYALRCSLPSGRLLTYWGAWLDENGKICFMGQNQTTRQWEKTDTWGGKLVENVVQAFARDCLAVAILRLEKAGFDICFHVHDEIVAEAPDGSRWDDMAEIMGQPIEWAPGLLLRADGYQTKFYMKD
jgi:DNA polymerase